MDKETEKKEVIEEKSDKKEAPKQQEAKSAEKKEEQKKAEAKPAEKKEEPKKETAKPADKEADKKEEVNKEAKPAEKKEEVKKAESKKESEVKIGTKTRLVKPTKVYTKQSINSQFRILVGTIEIAGKVSRGFLPIYYMKAGYGKVKGYIKQ